MAEKFPNLKTKYEEDDSSFSADETIPDNEELRTQPSRKTKTLKKSSKVISVSDDDGEFNSQNDKNPLNKNPLSHEPATNTQQPHIISDTFSLNHTSPHSSKTNSPIMPQTAEEIAAEDARIARIVRAVLSTQNSSNHQRSHPPKVDVPKLNMKNYDDWEKKMKSALKLHDLWVDPNSNPDELSETDKSKNEKAALYMSIHLDEHNAAFVNDTNDKCFISVWNAIKRFHQPRTATVLTDIYSQIQEIQHHSGQSIEAHLMKLEAQFARFHEIKETIKENHLVALILASVRNSPDFSTVFQSAMWEDESSLTISKVKSVLISTQCCQNSNIERQAHSSKFQANNKFSRYNSQPQGARNYQQRPPRQPRDPRKGFSCPECKMDNHTREQCNKSAKNHNGFQIPTKRANQVQEEPAVVLNENVQFAQGYAGHAVFSSEAEIQRTSRPSPGVSTSLKSRLGRQLNVSPYQNILPKKSTSMLDEDFLEIEHNANYDDFIDAPPSGSKAESQLLESSEGDHLIHNSNSHSHTKFSFQKINHNQEEITHHSFLNTTPELNLELNCMKSSSQILSVNCNLKNNELKMNSIEQTLWIIDSGATIHMCHSLNLLTNVKFHEGSSVIISDGRKIPIKGSGTLHFTIPDEFGLMHSITVENVAFVPDLTVNLLSVRGLASLGISIIFTENSCYIKHPKANILLATIYKSAYVLTIRDKIHKSSNNFVSMFCIHEWHRKMGHKNINHIKSIKNSMNLKITKCKCPPDCVACLKGKLHALPYPQSSEKPKLPREIVTTDICGPFDTQSIGGSKYFVTFTDACTDYTEVATIKNKSDCKHELMNYVKRCSTQFGQFPKIIRSDRGGEYLDTELQTFLKTHGIKFECSVPRCSPQNGIAERKNRTLVEAIRTLLFEKDLPKHLWAEALHHANNTFNAIPHNDKKQSPKDQFFDKHFNYPFIEFGSTVFFTTNPQNRSKLNERGESGIYLGVDHNSKGFRIFHQGKIRIERNVKFIQSAKIAPQEETTNDSLNIMNESSNDSIQIPELRRSERIREKLALSTSNVTSFEPTTYTQAISCSDKQHWIQAMNEELQSIENNDTWSLVDLPKGRTAIGSKWVFKTKVNDEGKVTRFKARLVAQGFTQKFGIDYDEVFAPVARPSTFRTLLSVAGKQNLSVMQYDVKTAFLNGSLDEEIYLKPPQGSSITNKVYKLNKALYGLKQAARKWNEALHECLIKLNFIQSKHDNCLYIFKNGYDTCFLIIHVDDMLISSKHKDTIENIASQINTSFELKCLGDVKQFLGINVNRTSDGSFTINQSHYISKIAETFQLEDSKGSLFPLDTGYFKLSDERLLPSNNDYRKIIGMLLYISTNSRPDISASVNILAQKVSQPRQLDYNESLRIVKYLLKTKELSLQLSSHASSIPLKAFSDANWAEDRTDRKSTSGFLCQIYGGSVAWSSKKQDVVSISTTEAEYYALAETVREITWLRELLSDFDINFDGPVTLEVDSQSCIKMIDNEKFSNRTKHIDVRYHFAKESIQKNQITLQYVPTDINIADMLTKPLAGTKIKALRELANLK